jgi:hypothetical protein
MDLIFIGKFQPEALITFSQLHAEGRHKGTTGFNNIPVRQGFADDHVKTQRSF